MSQPMPISMNVPHQHLDCVTLGFICIAALPDTAHKNAQQHIASNRILNRHAAAAVRAVNPCNRPPGHFACARLCPSVLST